MGGLFSSPKMSSPPPMMQAAPQVIYMPAPSDDSAEVQAAEAQQRKVAKLAKGRQSTILSGGAGLEEPATVGRKTLLGE